jgi:hypothetical protein
MKALPQIETEVVFLSAEEGGRKYCPKKGYMPHLVVGPIDQHQPITVGNNVVENYLGVVLSECPDNIEPSVPVNVTFVLMYYPKVNYSNLLPKTTFTIREGSAIIGYGKVLSKMVVAP